MYDDLFISLLKSHLVAIKDAVGSLADISTLEVIHEAVSVHCDPHYLLSKVII